MTTTTSVQDLEEGLLTKLQALEYEYRPDIRDRSTLEANFRKQFGALNHVALTESEFQRLLNEIVTLDVYEAARRLRNREAFIRNDGTPLNYTLVNIRDWSRNTFEVADQLRMDTGNSRHRHDVTLLVNGVPVVQIALKTPGTSPRRAMEQVVDYKNDARNGYAKTLLCFVQLFVVSDGANTWYFANNDAWHFAFDADEQFLPIYQFADEDNTKITHLDDFADGFLAKPTLGEMISKYMVLVASERKLLMMRPYQVYAVKSIIDCINRNFGDGYVWQTPGSGKTLTAFKASTLLKTNESIHKCVFVVDRKDLDRRTRDEFNRFQENCVEENTDTETLVHRLLSDDYADKVIVTTIQKLVLALDEDRKHNQRNISQGRSRFKQRLRRLREKRMVFIFDECHRSQLSENYRAIKEFFPHSQLFGFTGTPIFENEATARQIEERTCTLRTTKDLFQKELHAYRITHAIKDRNILRFHVDHCTPKDGAALEPGQTVTKETVIQAILDRHDAATGGRRFNALLATSSISEAIEYYEAFQTLQAERETADPQFVPLKIAAVFSPPAEGNKDIQQIQEDLPQEKEDNRHDPEGKKTALSAIIADYNQRYGANHDIKNFDLYYQDIQQRIRDQQFPDHDLPRKGQEKIDITVVVDMLLTGFDSRFLNTLYIDKNLGGHDLIHAFSRTNRVLNATKPCGHILDFRQQQKSVDSALARFSDTHPDQARKIWLVDKAPVVIDKFKQAVDDLGEFMQSQSLEAEPDRVKNDLGDDARGEFIKRFKEVQRLRIELDQYTDLTDKQREQVEHALPKNALRAFRGAYLETAQRLEERRGTRGGASEPTRPEVDRLDFEFVLFSSAVIDWDYIVKLIARYSDQDPKKGTINRDEIIGLIQSDAKFLEEREEMVEYVRSLKDGGGVDETAVRTDYEQFKADKQAGKIAAVAQAHGLATESLAAFVDTILQRMIFDGEQLTDLMEPLDLGWRERRERELALMTDLVPFLKRQADGREISGLNAYEH